jgi:hypothetical protein
MVDTGALTGAATLVWRDVEARLPIEHNTLFRIASITKPITSAAALKAFWHRDACRTVSYYWVMMKKVV